MSISCDGEHNCYECSSTLVGRTDDCRHCDGCTHIATNVQRLEGCEASFVHKTCDFCNERGLCATGDATGCMGLVYPLTDNRSTVHTLDDVIWMIQNHPMFNSTDKKLVDGTSRDVLERLFAKKNGRTSELHIVYLLGFARNMCRFIPVPVESESHRTVGVENQRKQTNHE